MWFLKGILEDESLLIRVARITASISIEAVWSYLQGYMKFRVHKNPVSRGFYP